MGKNKKLIIGILGISLLISAASFSYALWQRYFTQSGENTTTTMNCFDITYSGGDNVNLTNMGPMTDLQAMQSITPYEVTIENKCDTVIAYNVVLNKNATSSLDDNYVKVTTGAVAKLLSNTEPVPTNTSSVGSGYTNGTSNIISRSYVEPQGKKTVKVKTWMDNETTTQQGANKTFNYKISIEAIPYNEVPEMGNVTILGKSYPVISAMPDFSIGFPTRNTTSADKIKLSGLYQLYDDDGDTYYFRGNVTNNYVNFAGHTWRIVRINGDGTVRLILNEINIEALSNIAVTSISSPSSKYVGFTYDNLIPCTNETPCKSTYNKNGLFENSNGGVNNNLKDTLEKWYIDNLKDYDDNIVYTNYCNDTSYGYEINYTDGHGTYYYYGARKRFLDNKPSLFCPDPKNQNGSNNLYGGLYKLKVGLLSADEYVIAGYTDTNGTSSTNYLSSLGSSWPMTPYRITKVNMYLASSNGTLYDGWSRDGSSLNSGRFVNPVINVPNKEITTSGDGTSGSPLIVQ